MGAPRPGAANTRARDLPILPRGPTVPDLTRSCRNCGTDISHRAKNATSCSRACQLASVIRHPGVPLQPRTCRGCGVVFYPKRSDRVSCSPRCTARWHYRDRPDDYKVGARRWKADNAEKARVSAWNNKSRARTLPGVERGHVSYLDWCRLVHRHGGKCAYCGGWPEVLQMDHVVPLARGGRHSLGNVLPACERCNSSKGGALLAEWRLRRADVAAGVGLKHYSSWRRRRKASNYLMLAEVLKSPAQRAAAAELLRSYGWSVEAPAALSA